MGRPPIGKRAMTSTERVHRHRAKLRASKPAPEASASLEDAARWQAEIAAQQARIRELETELKHERERREAAETKAAKAAPRDNKDEQIAALRNELAAAKARIEEMRRERVAFRFGSESKRQEAKFKTEKPPLPPDEERDRRIKALTTQNRNLRAEMRHMGEWHRSEMSKVGGMSFATQGALAKVLHPDTRKQATEAQIDEACRLFTAWKADKDKARRRR
jgi:chromosome segregation ATPase